MNKITMTLIGAAGLIMAGCTSIPSETTVNATSYACGMVAGYTTNLSELDQSTKDSIVHVLDTVATVVPETNSTFVATWTPIINEEIQKLVDEGKLNTTNSAIVKTASVTVTSGIDYLLSRHENWKAYQNLVSAATSGFISGYKAVVSPTMSATATSEAKHAEEIKEDVEAYRAYLKSKK